MSQGTRQHGNTESVPCLRTVTSETWTDGGGGGGWQDALCSRATHWCFSAQTGWGSQWSSFTLPHKRLHKNHRAGLAWSGVWLFFPPSLLLLLSAVVSRWEAPSRVTAPLSLRSNPPPPPHTHTTSLLLRLSPESHAPTIYSSRFIATPCLCSRRTQRRGSDTVLSPNASSVHNCPQQDDAATLWFQSWSQCCHASFPLQDNRYPANALYSKWLYIENKNIIINLSSCMKGGVGEVVEDGMYVHDMCECMGFRGPHLNSLYNTAAPAKHSTPIQEHCPPPPKTRTSRFPAPVPAQQCCLCL